MEVVAVTVWLEEEENQTWHYDTMLDRYLEAKCDW